MFQAMREMIYTLHIQTFIEGSCMPIFAGQLSELHFSTQISAHITIYECLTFPSDYFQASETAATLRKFEEKKLILARANMFTQSWPLKNINNLITS